MRLVFVIIVAIGVASFSGCTSEKQGSTSSGYFSFTTRSAKTAKKQPHNSVGRITLGSWNVNFGVAGDESMIRTMGALNCDALFLQETTPLWENAIRQKLLKVYPHMKFVHGGGAGGIAVLSRIPIVSMTMIRPPKGGWFPAMLATIKKGVNSVQVLNVHLHPPLDNNGSVMKGYFSSKKLRKKEMTTFYARLNKKLPTVVLGDFNEDKKGSAVTYLTKRGFNTVLSSQNTWRWKTSFYITLRSQLDHVLYNKQLTPFRVKVLKTGRSDHYPLLVHFYLLKL